MKDTKDPLKIFRENVAGSIEPSELDAIDEANTELVDSSVTEAKAAPSRTSLTSTPTSTSRTDHAHTAIEGDTCAHDEF